MKDIKSKYSHNQGYRQPGDVVITTNTRYKKDKPKVLRADPYKANLYIKRKNKYLNTFELSQDDRVLHEESYTKFKEVTLDSLDNIISNEEYIAATPGSSNYTDEDIAALHTAMEELTPRQRIFVDDYLKGITQKETARRLGITQPTISLAWTGIRKLKNPTEFTGGILRKLKIILSRK